MRGQERSVEARVTLAEVFPASQRLGADSCPIQSKGEGPVRELGAPLQHGRILEDWQKRPAPRSPAQLELYKRLYRRMSWNCGFLSSPKPTFCPASSQTTTAMGQCANPWFGAALAQLPGGFHTPLVCVPIWAPTWPGSLCREPPRALQLSTNLELSCCGCWKSWVALARVYSAL